jgi:hypothetical protein
VGSFKQQRCSYRLCYWNGYFFIFRPDSYSLPFDGEAHLEIEEMLRADDGECSLLEMVQKIALRTHILLTPRFVHLARKARSYYYRDE